MKLNKTRILTLYTKLVCIYSAGIIAMMLFLTLFSLYLMANPLITTIDEFSYETMENPRFFYGIGGDSFIFRDITEEKFNEEKEYYYNIAYENHKREIPRKMWYFIVYLILHIIVFIVHFRLYKRFKSFNL